MNHLPSGLADSRTVMDSFTQSLRNGFKLGRRPEVSLYGEFRNFMMLDRLCSRRILATSAGGNCPSLATRPSAPTRNRNLETRQKRQVTQGQLI
jgi:hypothetical protein